MNLSALRYNVRCLIQWGRFFTDWNEVDTMSSSEMSCCYCQATFPAPAGTSGETFKCPQCGKRFGASGSGTEGDQAKGRAGLIRLALAVVAVPVLVFAGIKIYSTLSEKFKKPQLPAGPCSSPRRRPRLEL